jgi:hypothetical protein
MGLLDQAAPEQAAPQMGGLLGQSAAAPQGGDGLAMLTGLMQSPTPEMAQQVAAKFAQKGTPEAMQMSKMFIEAASDPAALKHIVEALLQHVQGAQ